MDDKDIKKTADNAEEMAEKIKAADLSQPADDTPEAAVEEAPATPAPEEDAKENSKEDATPEDATQKGIYKAKNPAPPKPKKPPKSKEQLAYESAKNERFKILYWQPFLRPIVALVTICIVTSLLLGLTNTLTQPVILQNASRAAEQARIELLPEADGFEKQSLDDLPDVTAIYKATNGTGWVIESYGRGYGGRVPVMVAFNADGVIVGVRFTENSETVGLGQKVREQSFADQFLNNDGQNVSLGDIDKIASATISSGAAVNAVNAAINAYHAKTGNASGGPANPEDVRAALLPGEALTAITIDAPNVQATAWRSDAGNYIIYGEKDSDFGSKKVVAAVAISEEGVILNLWLDTSGENEAFGATLARNQAFLKSFIGKSAPIEVDAVADITYSSNTVMAAVNSALNALPLAKEAA